MPSNSNSRTTYLRITDRRGTETIIRELQVQRGQELIRSLPRVVGVRFELKTYSTYKPATNSYLQDLLGKDWAVLAPKHFPWRNWEASAAHKNVVLIVQCAADKRLPPEKDTSDDTTSE